MGRVRKWRPKESKCSRRSAPLEAISLETEISISAGNAIFARAKSFLQGLEDLGAFDAILLGAVGHPDVAPGVLEKGLLLSLRFHFDQYINLRPVKLFPGVETP